MLFSDSDLPPVVPPVGAPPVAPSRAHLRRLDTIRRSAGWPCADSLELDLLAAAWIERVYDAAGRETIRLTATGLACLAGARKANQRRRDPHEQLAHDVAVHLAAAGRMAWKDIPFRVPPRPDLGGDGRWYVVRPDVYSLRRSSRADYLLPQVHEVKVSRADLLGDIRNPLKRAGYQHLSAEFFYVFPEGLAQLDDLPPECGAVVQRPDGSFHCLKPAPRRAGVTPGFQEWMTLARLSSVRADALEPRRQGVLGWEGETSSTPGDAVAQSDPDAQALGCSEAGAMPDEAAAAVDANTDEPDDSPPPESAGGWHELPPPARRLPTGGLFAPGEDQGAAA